MKRKNILLGSVGIIATAAAFVFTPAGLENGKYSRKSLSSLEDKSALDAQAWLQARFVDHQTGLPLTKERLQQISDAIAQLPKTRAMSFIEQGPDNIGGRTRAIQVDRAVPNRVWAGGVSGGLFRSDDGANNWQYVDTYEGVGSPNISSMAQLSDGTLFVATGSQQESFAGNGVWYTTDAGQTWTIVPGTGSLSRVTEVYAPENGSKVFMATNNGLKSWSPGDATTTNISVTSSATSSCFALSGSKDGQFMIAGMTGSSNTYVSSDAGQTWTNKASQVGAGGRMEYAVSNTTNSNGKYTVYAINTNNNLKSIKKSDDNGENWTEILGNVGQSEGVNIYNGQGTYNSIASVDPSNNGKLLVGGIDIWKWEAGAGGGSISPLTQWFLSPSAAKYAHADQHEMKWDGNKLYVGNDGGIGITFDPESAWYPANRGFNITQFYGIAADKNGSVLGGTQDNGSLYNNHQLATWKDFVEVSGGDGFQCEISFFNPDIIFTTIQYGNVQRSTDGGSTTAQFIPTENAFDPNDVGSGGTHPFHTNIRLAEYYDENSQDSVLFIPRQNYTAGTVVKVPSAASGDTIEYTLTNDVFFTDTLNFNSGLTNTSATSVVDATSGATIYLDLYTWNHIGTSGSGNTPPEVNDSIAFTHDGVTDTVVVGSVGTFIHYFGQNPSTGTPYDMGQDSVLYDIAWDTLTVQDPFQSWFVIYTTKNQGELWATRDALRLSSDVKWGVIARGIGTSFGGSNNPKPIDIEFSKDLNSMFFTTGGGKVKRIDGLGSIYTSDSDFETKAFYDGSTPPSATTYNEFTVGGGIEGIAINPNNANDLLVFRGTGGMLRSDNNAAGAATFSNVSSIAGSSSPASYDGIIDRNDPDILVVGTSHGVFYTENGGTSWEDASAGFTGTPVFEVVQNWRTWDEGNFRPGEIYVGTYGRGIWSSSSYLDLPDNGGNNNDEASAFEASLIAYPNPSADVSNLKFDLNYSSDVTIKVYNLAGREMISIEKENMKSGTNTIPLNIENLSKGTYIVKLSAGKDKLTTKIMKF